VTTLTPQTADSPATIPAGDFFAPGSIHALFWRPRYRVRSPVVAHAPFLFWLVGVLRARQVDLDSDEIQQLLESGRQASKLALEIEGRLSFVLHDDLALKSLRFGDALIDEANAADDGDDAVLRLETDFVLMADALGENIERLIAWLGGEAGTATPDQ